MGLARRMVEKAPGCGECESKCPYELPIIDTVKKSLERAKEITASSAGPP